MNRLLTRLGLSFIALTVTLSSVLSIVPQRVVAAPGVISFSGIGGTITCNAVIGQGVVTEDQIRGDLPISTLMYEAFYPGFPSGTRSEALTAEAENADSPLAKAGQQIFNNENVIYMYLVGVNAANDGQCADHGFFVQSPDNPNAFVGVGMRNTTSSNPDYTYKVGEYSKDTKSFRFANSATSRLSEWYEIKNSTSSTASHASFTSPTSGGGGGSVSTGPCAGIPSGSALNACMDLQFINFTTVSFRDETYILDSWGGGDIMRYKLIDSYDPVRDAENTKTGQQPYFEFATGDENGQLDVDIDGDGGDGEIENFIEIMNSLPSSFTGGKYVDYDSTGDEVEHTYFSSDNGTPTYKNVQNMRRMLRYFPAEKKVAFLRGFNPSGNEQDVAGLVFTQVGETNKFESEPLNGCTGNEGKATIDIGGDLASINSSSWRDAKLTLPKENCSSSHTALNVVLTGATTGQTVDNASTAGTDPANADDGEVEQERTCTTEVNFLGWILCPVLSILDEATKWLEGQIAGFLFVDPGTFSRDSGIYSAWSTFRGIATVIIVIIALMMIFSQAMGAGPFDNYSVKKLLPRLLIAGIGIQLSWFLLVQLINIFNILGNGIGNLLLNPFGLNTNTELGDIIGGITQEASFGDFALGFAAMAAIIPAFIGGFVGLAVGVLGAVMVGFITLIVRDMIIFLGVVLAPVAIAMSVLPGTQKTSKWWWESLEKALMMYPLVIALLATGKIVGSLLLAAATPDGDAGIKMTYLIAAIIAWYAPFFFLPKALQAGGQALGKISGLAGDRSKGLIDRAKGWSDSRKKYKQGIKAEKRAEAGSQGYKVPFMDKRLGFTAGIARAGMRGRGGQPIVPLTSRSRNRANASMEAARNKLEQAQTEEQATLLDREYQDQVRKWIASGETVQDKKKWVKEQYGRAPVGSARQRALYNSLVAEKAIKQLEEIHLDAIASGDYRKVQAVQESTSKNFPAIKEFAPHIATASFTVDDKGNPPSLGYESLTKASSGDMGKWKPDTAELALKLHQEGYHDFSGQVDKLKASEAWKDVPPELQAVLDKMDGSTPFTVKSLPTAGDVSGKSTTSTLTPPPTATGSKGETVVWGRHP